MNVGASHYGMCDEHLCWWPIGAGLFSPDEHDTEEQWERNRALLANRQEVKPVYPDRASYATLGMPTGEPLRPCEEWELPF